MRREPEHIRHEPNDNDAWKCICGNTGSRDGFYPIDETSHEVEPTAADWRTGLYCCTTCGRVIDPESLEVVRRIDPNTFERL